MLVEKNGREEGRRDLSMMLWEDPGEMRRETAAT